MGEIAVIETARDGSPTLKKNGVYLLSRYRPLSDAVRFIDSIIKPDGFYILFGGALGYSTRALLDRQVFPDSILVIEPEESLLEYQRRACSSVKALPSPAALSAILETALRNRRKPVFAVMESYRKAYPEECSVQEKEFINALRIAAENVKVSSFFSRLWFLNLARNLSFASAGRAEAADFKAPVTDAPVIVTAAGFSLDRHMPGLVRNRDRFILLSVLSSQGAALNSGIVPDAVVITDGGAANIIHAGGLPEHVPVLSSVYANSALLSGIKNPVLFFDLETEWKACREGRRSFMLDNPSVTVDAGLAAQKLTTGPVIFCGFDLSYSQVYGSHNRDNALTLKLNGMENRLKTRYNSFLSFCRRKDLLPLSTPYLYTTKSFNLVRELSENAFMGSFYTKGGLDFRTLREIENLDIFLGRYDPIAEPFRLPTEKAVSASLFSDFLFRLWKDNDAGLVKSVLQREEMTGRDTRAAHAVILEKLHEIRRNLI